ncbi:MAG: ArsR family transcriptional regulator [Rhodobiaceae bacterium]|nr:ArsR family transcriptional regulator [Rhodobiaceae bacterium]
MNHLLSVLRAAGEPTRLRILAILSLGELTVSELTQVLLQSQPRISRHLKLLADAGLIVRYPEGSWVFYRLDESAQLGDLLAEIIGSLPLGDHELQRDRERLAEVRAERAERAQAYFAANATQWDSLRANHIPETAIEERMGELIGRRNIDLLVDLGTGTGRMLEIFGTRATRAVGFDISTDMLTIARAKLDELAAENCQVRQGDCANVPLEDNVADIVILHQVLHFLDDPQRAVNEAARITRPGGLVLIADFGPHEMEDLRNQHAHRRLGFADEEMNHMLRAAGLFAAAGDTLTAQNTPLTVAMWQAEKTERNV